MNRIFVLAAIIAAPAFSFAANSYFSSANYHNCKQEVVAKAETLVKQANDSLNAGEITKTDVAIAEGVLLDAKFCANKVAKQEYCETKKTNLESIVTGLTEEIRVGSSTQENLNEFKARVRDLKKVCEQNGAFPVPVRSCTEEQVNAAIKAYDLTIKQFKVGEVSKIDVQVAKSDLQDLMVCSKRLGLFGYCVNRKTNTTKFDVIKKIENFYSKQKPGVEREDRVELFDNMVRAALYCKKPR